MRRSRLGTLPWLVPVVLGLAAAAALSTDRAAGQRSPLSANAPSAVAAPKEADDITGSIEPTRSLPLTDEQRGRIFDAVMELHNAPVADVAPSARLPRSVPLQDLPPGVAAEVPMVQGYKFVKLDDRILLVSPLDRSVVAEMPRYKIILD